MRVLVIFIIALGALVWIDVPGRIQEFCIHEVSKKEVKDLSYWEENYFRWSLDNIDRFKRLKEAGTQSRDAEIQKLIRTSEEVCNSSLKVFEKYSNHNLLTSLSDGIEICNELAWKIENLITELEAQEDLKQK